MRRVRAGDVMLKADPITEDDIAGLLAKGWRDHIG